MNGWPHGPRAILRAGVFVASIATGVHASSVAVAQDFRAADREIQTIERETDTLLETPIGADAFRSPRWVEERIADADIYLQLHDYLRASIVLTDVVEHHADHPAIADARIMLADALFEAGDFFGARVRYRDILDRAADPAHHRFAERALGRVVEIALRTRSFEGIERYFDRFGSDEASEAAAATTYFRAKYVFGQAVPEAVIESGRVGPERIDENRLGEALRLFGQVAPGTAYAPQASYYVGVVHILRGDVARALAAFRAATSVPTSTVEQRRVSDLSWLAVGRVFHALHQYSEALEAYHHVPRTSVFFPRALFESAYVQVANDDPASALRSLEVLVAAAPNSPLVPESQLVRANLLLRRQRFDEADAVFDEVRETIVPIASELDGIATHHEDLPAYFAGVVREQREVFSVDVLLPESARRWSEPDTQFERAAAALSDLTLTRQLIRETDELCERLELALESTAIVNVFGDTRNQAQGIEAVRTRVTRARLAIAHAEERGHGSESPERTAARARRHALERQFASAPSTGDAMDRRDGERVAAVRALSRHVREIEVEVTGLEARVTAMQHYLTVSPLADRAGQAAVEAELDNHRRSIAQYRRQIDELHRAIELARIDVGVGDDDYQNDARLRAELDAALTEERRLAGGGSRLADARLSALAAIDARLDERALEIVAAVTERTNAIRTVVAEERVNLARYRTTLAELEGDAEVVVGGVSYETFVRVREHFHDVAIRADVGHVDVAWMRREHHREELESLTQSRGIELEEIDSEYDDILDRQRNAPGSSR